MDEGELPFHHVRPSNFETLIKAMRKFQISDCGMVLEEQPHKVCEALRLFLQGLGYGK